MLCNQCQTITFQTQTPRTEEESPSCISIHHPDLDSLQRSASHGCHFCTLLWDRLGRPASKAISTLARAKPKPPNPECEAVQLYCESYECGKRPEAMFAYSGRERSVAFEVLELESGLIYLLSSYVVFDRIS